MTWAIVDEVKRKLTRRHADDEAALVVLERVPLSQDAVRVLTSPDAPRFKADPERIFPRRTAAVR